jgi:N-acyl-D-aspartate/D-glutamate deacylase
MVDTLIKNALIVDGSGKASFTGDLAVKDGTIVEVGPKIHVETAEVIDAAGLNAMPGFIDLHRHGDLAPYKQPEEAEELRQGITTFINGNCGFSAVPSAPERFTLLNDYARPIMGSIPAHLSGASFAVLRREVESLPLYSNMGYLTGGGALRIAVKGFDSAPITEAEMDRLRGMLSESLEAGAFGLSLGLMYVPENYYSVEELVRLCATPAKYGRIVTVHLWGEGNSLLESIDKILTIARRSGAAFHISHLKAAGRRNWRRLILTALEKIAAARAEGLDISFDVYPYHAGSTALYTLLPPALQKNGIPELLANLRDKEIRLKTAAELKEEQEDWDNLIASTGWQSVVIAGGDDVALVGRTVADIAESRGSCCEECVFDLLIENKGNVPIVLYSICEEDMEKILAAPDAIVISDALYSSGGQPHPRRYGSQARFLSRYAGKIGLERAVRSLTDLPARRMGLNGRGLLSPGYTADIVLADMARLRDTATFEKPLQYPTGIVCVFMAGHTAFREAGGPLEKYGQFLVAN